MAYVDISEAFLDPELMEWVVAQRRVATVGEDGNTVISPGSIRFLACVQPADGRTLALLPDEARTAAAISVWTRTPLAVQTDTTLADLIQWGGRSWIVTHIQPFLNWGSGYNQAVCTLQALEVETPGPTPDPGS